MNETKAERNLPRGIELFFYVQTAQTQQVILLSLRQFLALRQTAHIGFKKGRLDLFQDYLQGTGAACPDQYRTQHHMAFR